MPHNINHLFSGFCPDRFAAEGVWDLIDYSRIRAFPGRINLIQRRAPPSSRQHHPFVCVKERHAVIRLAPQNHSPHELFVCGFTVVDIYNCHGDLRLVMGNGFGAITSPLTNGG